MLLNCYIMEIAFLIAFLAGFVFSFLPKKDAIKKYLASYLIYFGLPFLVFVSLSAGDYKKWLSFALTIVVFSILSGIIIYFLTKRIKVAPEKQAALFLSGAVGNFAYIGMPIGFMFFQEEGMALAALAAASGGIIHSTLKIYLANRYVQKSGPAFKQMLKFPLMYSMIFALILSQAGFVFPLLLRMFAKSAIYLSIFLVGISLNLKRLEKVYIWGIVLKFVVVPIVALFLLLFIKLPDIQKTMFVLLSLMPPALINTSIAINYKFDGSLTAGITSFGTILFILAVAAVKFFI